MKPAERDTSPRSFEGLRVLCATMEAGGGHTTAARAWAARFAELGVQADVIDTVEKLGPRSLDRSTKALWRAALRAPRAVSAMQTLTDHIVPAGITQRVQGLSVFDHATRLARFVEAEGYDLVLATHMYPLQAMVIAKQRGLSDVPIVGFNPDSFDTHALLAVRGSDLMAVPTLEAAIRIRRHGVPAKEVRVTGYPIDRRFMKPRAPQSVLRSELGVDPELPLLLLSLGAEGIGPQAEAWVEALAATGLRATIAVLTARNQALRERLESESESLARQGIRLAALGFRNDIPDWLAAADLVIAKAGPASTLEALAMGTPIGHVYVAGSHERLVVDYALSRGVGAWWPQPRPGASEAAGWLRDRPALSAWRERIAKLELPLSQLEDVLAVLSLAGSPRSGGR
jgi:UDP-N-acetylglucosamine:LPS N-acetylglucosamine transferase